MNTRQRKLLLAALPIALVTAGCLMASEDIDELVEDEVAHRTALGEGALLIEIVEAGSSRYNWDPFQDEYADMEALEGGLEGSLELGENTISTIPQLLNADADLQGEIANVAHQEAEDGREQGEMPYSDYLTSVIIQAELEMVFGNTAAGDVDPCQIDITQNADALMEHHLSLRAYDSGSGINMLSMSERDSAADCGSGDGFYFGVEDGVETSISLCPQSCDAVGSSIAGGSAVLVEVVIEEG